SKFGEWEGGLDDSQIEERRIPPVFEEKECQHWQATQSGHFPDQSRGRAARARSAILQAPLRMGRFSRKNFAHAGITRRSSVVGLLSGWLCKTLPFSKGDFCSWFKLTKAQMTQR